MPAGAREHMVVDAAVSPDGKQVAMVSLSTDGGAMRSSLQVFDISSAENAPIKEYAQNDLMLCRVIYFDGGTVLAVGDSCLLGGQPRPGPLFEKQSYPEYELTAMTEGENSAALVLRRYGNTDGGRLLVVRSTGDVAYTADFEGSFRDISPAGSEGYWLLTGGELLHAGGKGWDQKLDIPADGRMVCGLGDRADCARADQPDRIPAVTDGERGASHELLLDLLCAALLAVTFIVFFRRSASGALLTLGATVLALTTAFFLSGALQEGVADALIGPAVERRRGTIWRISFPLLIRTAGWRRCMGWIWSG